MKNAGLSLARAYHAKGFSGESHTCDRFFEWEACVTTGGVEPLAHIICFNGRALTFVTGAVRTSPVTVVRLTESHLATRA